jgi:hypothetical protein
MRTPAVWTFPLVLLGALQGCATQKVGEYEPIHAAGEHHIPIIDNERVRVLEVTIPPGDTVPFHLHSMPSVFITLEPASLVFYDLDGNVVKRVDRSSFHELPAVEWRGPAPAPRKVQNVDAAPLRALRIELKE